MKRSNCRVMVTGAGSGVGQGIGKALRASQLPVTLISADISAMNPALYRADDAVLIPLVESPSALDQMIDVIRMAKVDVVMIGSEFDLRFFAKHRITIEQQTGAKVIVCPEETVRIADDKWLTAEFLRNKGMPYAESALPSSVSEAVQIAEQWGFPVVVKTRSGTSSRHVHIVDTPALLVDMWPRTPNPFLQRVVCVPSSELDTEYTCSVFRAAGGQLLGPFHARRTLRSGTSWTVEVDRFPHLDELLLALAENIDFVGSLNVQLMVGQSGPVPFELNARFSGTTAVRAHFGFNEPAFAVLSYFYGETIPQPVIKRGLAMRYHEEVFIDGLLAKELVPGESKGIVHPWF